MHAILGFAVALLLQAQDTKTEPFLKDIEAFEAKDKKTPPPENEIVAVGSSSIRFWQSTEAFPDLKIINRGFGGSMMSDSLHYCDRIITKYKPRIVVVFAGGNDINAKRTPERVADDYKALCGKIHAELPKTKIYFISLYPNVQRKSQDPACMKVNELIEKFTKTDPRLGYIDTQSKLRAEDGGPRPELLRPDGLHMNDDGYKIWNEIVGAVLRKAP
jgi:lysophospholipase L1-like esterase